MENTLYDCWFWRENEQQLRWWTPRQTQLIETQSLSQLVGAQSNSLSALLPITITEELSAYFSSAEKAVVRLHLADDVQAD